MRFKIALAQVSASERKRDNLKKGVELIRTASERGAELIVLPEQFMAYTPIDAPASRYVGLAEDVSGDFVTGLAAEARKCTVHVVAGILEKSCH